MGWMFSSMYNKASVANAMGGTCWADAVKCGKFGSSSRFCVIESSTHLHFSDVPLLMPQWLPLYVRRWAGVATHRDPKEIAHCVQAELDSFLAAAVVEMDGTRTDGALA